MPDTRHPASDDRDLPRPTDPVADDIASRNPDSGDISAGEQVLDEGRVAPEPDDFHNGDAETADQAANADEVPDMYPEAAKDAHGDTSADRARSADERTDAAAPPAQTEPGS